MKNIILAIAFVCLIFSLNYGNKAKPGDMQALDCNNYFLRFKEYYASGKKDSALIYINKAIDCDGSKNNYKNTKLNFLISTGSYKDAINYLDKTSFLDRTSLNIIKGVLNLKINNIEESNKELKEAFEEYKKIEKPSTNELFYFIALINYFENSDEALNKLNQVEKEFSPETYEGQIFSALKKNILENKKDVVLFNLFNIKD